jgi:hypothetical protein
MWRRITAANRVLVIGKRSLEHPAHPERVAFRGTRNESIAVNVLIRRILGRAKGAIRAVPRCRSGRGEDRLTGR